MQIQVHSEVGRLQAVLVHRPGPEIVRMTQHDLERMLFDDILSPSEAAREHTMLSDIMTATGTEVLELTDLLEAALEAAGEDDIEALVSACCCAERSPRTAPILCTWPAVRLARALLEGVYWRELAEPTPSLAAVTAQLRDADPMALRPLPNIMFLRDPCISVYDRAVQGRMATLARAREPLLVAFALTHAPSVRADISFRADDRLDEAFHAVEGGDVLVLSDDVLMIGCSERTRPETIERLAHEALFPAHPNLRRVYAVIMPTARSVMHLDTILTQVNRNLFLGHQPLIAGSARKPGLPVVRIDRDGPAAVMAKASTLDVLRDEFGRGTRLVPCGGDDPLHQEREQWTDGANAVALGPGGIMLYARNRKTVEALERHGLRELHLPLEQPADERNERVAAAMDNLETQPTVFTFTGSELSRARGGGRCLTMPLRREPLA
ncbi:MAG: arginine deiminase family protein [Myxococcota bacterium]